MSEAIAEPILTPIAAPVLDDRAQSRAVASRLIMRFEGFSRHAYRDGGGKWTIGYGSTMIDGHPVLATTPDITTEQAVAMMQDELSHTADRVDGMVSAPLMITQRAVLYSLAFNIGTGALRTSTLLRRLNEGHLQAAADQFEAWVNISGKPDKGLKNRRADERDLFLGITEA